MSLPTRAGKFVYLWAPVLFYAVFIFFLSSCSFRLPWFGKAQKIHADWAVHVVEYSVLGLLLARALWWTSPMRHSAGRIFAAALFIGALYGVSDEFHQRFVPYRDSSPQDLAADTVGVALGTWLWITKQTRLYA